MAWTQKEKIADDVAVTAGWFYSDDVELTLEKTAIVQVTAAWPGSTTDDLLIYVFSTLDETSENWDTATLVTVTSLVPATNPGAVSVSVSGVYRFRLGFFRDGATDTITTNAYMRIYEKGA